MLEKLKEYKELITIIVFFIGGFIWIETQFPKKVDLINNVSNLECLLDKYMCLTQYQMRRGDLQNEIQELAKQVNMMDPNLILTPALAIEFDGFKSNVVRKQNELSEVNQSIRKIHEELQREVCKRR